MAKVDLVPMVDCWLWNGSTCRKGYGFFRLGDRIIGAHRFSYQEFVGEIQTGMLVCHKCDVPGCVRPDHLFLGTAKDNAQDMIAKGRNHDFGGQENGRSKLTRSVVNEIRSSYIANDLNFGGQALAEKFGVSQPMISHIVNRRRWQT